MTNFRKLALAIWHNLDVLSDLASVVLAWALLIAYQVDSTRFTTEQLIGGVLGILSLVAVSGIIEKRNRIHRIEQLLVAQNRLIDSKVINRIRAEEFFQPADGLTDEVFAHANRISISGITLGNTTNRFSYVLGQRLVAGAHIRVILLEATNEALHQLVLRSWGPATIEYYQNRLNNTAEFLRIVAKTPGSRGKLEIGFLPYVPSFGLILADSEPPHSVAYVEMYHHKSDKPNPAFVLRSTLDMYWHRFFEEQFELLWNQCRVEQTSAP